MNLGKKIERFFGGRRDPSPKQAWRILAQHCDAVRIPTANGTFLCSTSDQTIARSLFLGDDFGAEEFKQLMEYVSPDLPEDAIFLDIGANIGTHTVYALRSGYFKRAICFEPEPGNFSFLQANIELNGLTERADLRNVALGASKGQLRLTLSSSNHGDHRISAEGEIAVEVVTLNEAVADCPPEKCFLHMDVQGYEPMVLKGADNLLGTTSFLLSEFWPDELQANGTWEMYRDLVSGFREIVDIETGDIAGIDDLPVFFERYRKSAGWTNLLFRR